MSNTNEAWEENERAFIAWREACDRARAAGERFAAAGHEMRAAEAAVVRAFEESEMASRAWRATLESKS
jgi:hypothetical protein